VQPKPGPDSTRTTPSFGSSDEVAFATRMPLGVLGNASGLVTYAAVTSRSYHPGGLNVLVMDGSVRFFSNTTKQEVWRALGTRAGGEVVNEN
jgi:prepilin-type processing-associated H-X9-DG protein